MSITFGHSGEWQQSQTKEACDRCAQIADSKPRTLAGVDPKCWLCHGTGEASVYSEQPGSFNLCNANAKAFLVMLLGRDIDMWTMSSIPLTTARQRAWVTRARFPRIAEQYTRAGETELAERRQRGNLTELHPRARVHSAGLGVEQLQRYLEQFDALIAAAAEAGASSIIWG